MKRRRQTPEQIIRTLRESERLLGEGKTIPEAAKRSARGDRRLARGIELAQTALIARHQAPAVSGAERTPGTETPLAP